jgi:hypothetical protein
MMVAYKQAKEWGPNKTAVYDAFHDLIHGYKAKYPSGQVPLPAVAERTGLCLRTVKEHKEALVSEGSIEVLRRGGFRRGPSTYKLAFVAESPKVVPAGTLKGFPSPDQSANSALSSPDQGANPAPCDRYESAEIAPVQSANSAPLRKNEKETPHTGSSNYPELAAAAAMDPSCYPKVLAAFRQVWDDQKRGRTAPLAADIIAHCLPAVPLGYDPDSVIAEAVHVRPHQKSPGLWRDSIPEEIETLRKAGLLERFRVNQ